MWVLTIFNLIWNSLFSIQLGNLPLTFGGLLLGAFVLSFVARTVYKFMHRGDKE